MDLINTDMIEDGMIRSVKLEAHTITIILTDGGDSVQTGNIMFIKNGKENGAKSAESGRLPGRADMPSTPDNKGYTFAGWLTKENGRGTGFTNKIAVPEPIE